LRRRRRKRASSEKYIVNAKATPKAATPAPLQNNALDPVTPRLVGVESSEVKQEWTGRSLADDFPSPGTFGTRNFWSWIR
jgi:hypothetical protein